jgi:hypothetical protein
MNLAGTAGERERSGLPELLLVGANPEQAAALLADLGELAGPVRQAPLEAAPGRHPDVPRVVVIFAPTGHAAADHVSRWLDAAGQDRVVVACTRDDETPSPGLRRAGIELVPARYADRLVPTVARLLNRARTDGPEGLGASIASYCERLLLAATARQLCHTMADEIAASLGCEWSAVLNLSGQASILDVTGSTGEVPGVLHDCHSMTPSELASAAGWDAGGSHAQMVGPGGGTRLRTLLRDGASAAIAVLPGDSGLRGVAFAGWRAGHVVANGHLRDLAVICSTGSAALQHANTVADLRMSDQTKSEFVATMSHELRNPLSAILGYTELLVHGDFGSVSDEQREILRRAHQSARALLDLINATLDISRFEVGDRVDEPASIDVMAVLSEQIAAAADRGIAARFTLVGHHGPLVLSTDPGKLSLALRQVLEAAVATNAGTLQLEARSVDGGCAVEIKPAGMDAAAGGAPVLVDSPENNPATSTPVSLVVAKRLMEILGGSLAVWCSIDREHVAFRMRIPDRVANA